MKSEETRKFGEFRGNGATQVIIGDVKSKETAERGDFRWNFTRKVVVGEVNEFEIETMRNGNQRAIKAVVTEVQKAELVKGGEGVNSSTEVEGGKSKGGNTAVGAVYSEPRSRACSRRIRRE